MLSDDPPTNSELDRRFDRLENSINAGFARIDQQISSLVTHDMFALYQRSIEQRVATGEEYMGRLNEQHVADIQSVRGEVDRVNQARGDDRRNLVKIVATVAVGLLGVMATLAAVILPMLAGQ